MTLQELNKAIASIKTRSTSLKASIQDAKNGCLIQIDQEQANCTPIADLLNAVGNGIRYGALKSLFEQAGVKINKNKTTKKWQAKVGKSGIQFGLIEELKKANWEDFKHDDDVKTDYDKAKSAFENALKWLDKFPELAAELGLAMEKENNGEIEKAA